MAIGERLWCDFVVYTPKEISIERITFDPEYWDNVLTKLTEFYDNYFALEIVSPLQPTYERFEKGIVDGC